MALAKKKKKTQKKTVKKRAARAVKKSEEPKQESLEAALSGLDVDQILWPDRHSELYPSSLLMKRGRKRIPKGLVEPEDRLRYAGERVQHYAKSGVFREHPLLILYFLNEFEKPFKPKKRRSSDSAVKKAAREVLRKKKGAKKSPAELKRIEKEKRNKSIYSKIQRIKGKLGLPVKVRKLSQSGLIDQIIEAMRKLTEERLSMIGQIRDMGADPAESAGGTREIKQTTDIAARISELEAENDDLKVQLTRENKRATLLEEEIQRLAEQIVSSPAQIITGTPEDYENLYQEYKILSQKYDALVSKNIVLSNRLDQAADADTLEQILDGIRERVNAALRSDFLKESMLIARLKKEIDQLQRARVYLGRALYDVGILYARINKRDEALTELRAARELGVEDSAMIDYIKQSGKKI